MQPHRVMTAFDASTPFWLLARIPVKRDWVNAYLKLT